MARTIVTFSFFLGILSTSMFAVAADPGDCLSAEEAQLFELINQYRLEEGHATVPWSKSLTQVAQWHVWDLEINNPHASIICNMQSWSDQGIWTPVCYTSDHANAAGMWVMPGFGQQRCNERTSCPAADLDCNVKWVHRPAEF